jgi:hypothetical protein
MGDQEGRSQHRSRAPTLRPAEQLFHEYLTLQRGGELSPALLWRVHLCLVLSYGPGVNLVASLFLITVPQAKILFSAQGKILYEFPYRTPAAPGSNKAKIEIPFSSVTAVQAEGETLLLQLSSPPTTYVGTQQMGVSVCCLTQTCTRVAWASTVSRIAIPDPFGAKIHIHAHLSIS